MAHDDDRRTRPGSMACTSESAGPSNGLGDSHGGEDEITKTGSGERVKPEYVCLENGRRDGDASKAKLIVVMGVSGAGKSTLGGAIAARLRLPFVDGDDLHPVANVAKMSRGEPLDDNDRWPWLERVRREAAECVCEQTRLRSAGVVEGHPETRGDGNGVGWMGAIVACSALKRAYRAVLRGEVHHREGLALETYFVYLKGDREVMMARMLSRRGHFMKAGMLESQLDALESPEGEERVVTVPAAISTEEQVQRVLVALQIQQGERAGANGSGSIL